MPEKKTTPKKAVAKKAAAKKAPAKKAAAKKAAPVKKAPARKKAAKPVAGGFSLNDALKVASTQTEDTQKKTANLEAKEKARKALEEAEAKAEKRNLGAASLADILGYNPAAPVEEKKKLDESDVPAKYKKFYKLLSGLRDHLTHGLNKHAEETLKRSSKDDSGDLSSYGQHMADAGTETFDRDFALSMVSNEQEALQEVEEAIDRIFKGTYGICEMTGKQIREERLMAVPFTRYSIKTQQQIEKNTYKGRNEETGAFEDASSEDSLNYGNEEEE